MLLTSHIHLFMKIAKKIYDSRGHQKKKIIIIIMIKMTITFLLFPRQTSFGHLIFISSSCPRSGQESSENQIIAGEILAKVLLNRLNEYPDQAGLLPESQWGFRKDRGTINMVFKARQLREISRTKCGPLHDLCRPHQSS